MYEVSAVLQKNSPYTRFFKQFMLDFTKGILMSSLVLSIENCQAEDKVSAISFYKCAGLFLMLCVSLIISLSILAYEHHKPPSPQSKELKRKEIINRLNELSKICGNHLKELYDTK